MRTRPPTALLLVLATACATDPTPPISRPRPACAEVPGEAPVLGCANYHNLRAMIADPGELTEGRPYGGGDALVEAAAVARLRADKVKKLRQSGTTNRPSAEAPQ